jgi:hypothetical protein
MNIMSRYTAKLEVYPEWSPNPKWIRLRIPCRPVRDQFATIIEHIKPSKKKCGMLVGYHPFWPHSSRLVRITQPHPTGNPFQIIQ